MADKDDMDVGDCKGILSMLAMKQLASLEKQGGSGKKCALSEAGGGRARTFK